MNGKTYTDFWIEDVSPGLNQKVSMGILLTLFGSVLYGGYRQKEVRNKKAGFINPAFLFLTYDL